MSTSLRGSCPSNRRYSAHGACEASTKREEPAVPPVTRTGSDVRNSMEEQAQVVEGMVYCPGKHDEPDPPERTAGPFGFLCGWRRTAQFTGTSMAGLTGRQFIELPCRRDRKVTITSRQDKYWIEILVTRLFPPWTNDGCPLLPSGRGSGGNEEKTVTA
jgi:hypothetical protein